MAEAAIETCYRRLGRRLSSRQGTRDDVQTSTSIKVEFAAVLLQSGKVRKNAQTSPRRGTPVLVGVERQCDFFVVPPEVDHVVHVGSMSKHYGVYRVLSLRATTCIKLLINAGFADKLFLSQDSEIGGSLLPVEVKEWRETIDPPDGLLFVTRKLIPHLRECSSENGAVGKKRARPVFDIPTMRPVKG